MEIILLLVCFAVTILIGWSLLGIVFYKSGDLFLFERLSLSYGMGMGAVGLEMLLFYFFKLQFSILNLLLPWIPVVIFSVFSLKAKPLPLIGQRRRLSLFERFLLAGISFEVILAFFRAFLKPLESFDSIAMYAMRSKIMYLSRMIPPNFFSEITPRLPNPDYPLLVPLAEVWVYTFLGSLNDLLVKAVFPMYFLSILVIFFFLLRRFISRSGAFLFTFLLATIPQFNRFATVGYTDLILAYYYSVGMIYLFLWMKEKRLQILLLAGIFCGFAIFTKNEGMVLYIVDLILLAIFLLCSLKRQRLKLLREATVFILTALLIAGPWLGIRLFNNLQNDLLQFSDMGAERFMGVFKKLDRIPVILYEFQKQFFGPKKWNLVWILFLALLVSNIKKSFSGDLKYFSLSVALILIFYTMVYMLIPIDGPIGWHVASGVSRLFIHFLPITVFWLALMCRQQHLIEEI
ncbi:glycosyltransferase family 39 protein [Omnitrophica bacterium]|nr:glycosyltransferase family 39 protein [Candidatus Omnitrophota bacterium]